jgi:peptidoglycan/LPS O-acetylase OafA/YrhL
MRASIDGSWVPYFLLMPVILLIAHLLARCVPFYRDLLARPQTGRYQTLDGLRGLLATGVFFCHAVVFYQYLGSHEWQRPASPFYAALGEFAVALFFMITGFLFWSKAIAGNGRVAVLPLYWARFWRLAPAYLFSASLISLAVALRTGPHLREPVPILVRELLRVWSLGVAHFDALNGISTVPINAAVTWTLQYEWLFYLTLPALAWLARPGRFGILLLLLLVAYRLHWVPDLVYLVNFAVGMGVAHLMAAGNPLRSLIARRGWGLVPVAAALTVGLGVPTYTLKGSLCAAFVFLSIVSGVDLCGLLRTQAVRLLGTVSYSIYLLHGTVLYVGLGIVRAFYPIQRLTPPAYWLVMAACAVLLVCLSAVTYRWLEYPFLRVPLPTRRGAPGRLLQAPRAELRG